MAATNSGASSAKRPSTWWARRQAVRFSSGDRSRNSRRPAPAEKSSSTPERITATATSASATRPPATSSSSSSPVSRRFSGGRSSVIQPTRPSTSALTVIGRSLLGGHAGGAVEADGLAVEDPVLEDVAAQGGVLLGLAEAGGEGDLGAEGGADLVGHGGQHRGVEDPGGDRHHPDADPGQLAGDRQGHAGHPGLAGRLGGLADLALQGGTTRGGERPPD